MKKLSSFWEKNKKTIFGIIAIILIAVFSYSVAPKVLQNDTYYTVAIGNLIKTNGIDMQDHFSWHDNLPYTYPHWLYDIIISSIYNIGGWDGVYISVCVCSIILGLTIYSVNKKLNKNQIISLVITLLSMYILKDYIAARAQLITFIIFTITIFFIEKFIENPKRFFWGIGIIVNSILIANLHCAVWPFLFILSLPYIGEYIISILADILIYRKIEIFLKKIEIKFKKNNEEKVQAITKELEEINESVEKRRKYRENEEIYKIELKRNNNVKWLILVMIICILTGFFTPIGMTPFTYLYNTMQGNTTQNINEHLPLTLINNLPILCTIIIFIAILTFTKVKIRLKDLLMLGGLTLLMFFSKRQSTMFVLFGGIILNRLIVNAFEIYTNKKIDEISEKIVNLVSILTIIVVTSIYSYKNIKKTINNPYVNESTYPVKAAEWILENLDINNIKLYNEYNYGSYLLYKGIPVFIDSRADLYAPEFSGNEKDIFTDFINTSSIAKFYGNTIKEYGITHIILYKNSKMSMIIDKADFENYNKIYSDDNFVIYEVIK